MGKPMFDYWLNGEYKTTVGNITPKPRKTKWYKTTTFYAILIIAVFVSICVFAGVVIGMNL